VTIKPKGEWMLGDLGRHADRYGVPFRMNPHFIFNTLSAMRGAIWAQAQGRLEGYDRAMFEAAWATGGDLTTPESLATIAAQAGFDPDAFVAGIQDPAVKQSLIDETNRAVERGAFGVPTMYVGDEMHFGQDRLDWVERALAA